MNSSDQRPSILVTGGSGFIGTHLIERLLVTGAQVTNVDIRPPRLSTHTHLWTSADITRTNDLQHVVNTVRPSVIFNLAAVASISPKDEWRLQENIDSVRSVLSAAREIGCGIVHISSQLVLGPGAVPTSDGEYQPYTLYGHSKAQSEDVLRASDYNDWLIVRPTNVWGPMHPSFASGLWKYLDRGWYLHPSQTHPIRSYGYVTNVVEQLVLLSNLNPSRRNRETFYVSDPPITSTQWVDEFSVQMRGREARRFPVLALQIAARLGDLLSKVGWAPPLDSGRLFRMTTDYPVALDKTFEVLVDSYQRPTTLKAGVEETVRWLRTGQIA